jgi:hypothetical protein
MGVGEVIIVLVGVSILSLDMWIYKLDFTPTPKVQ